MLPFWIAGGAVAKQTVLDPAKATALSIGEFAWELRQSLVGQLTLSSEGGPTEELEGADVDVAAYVNGVPVHRMIPRAAARLASATGDVGELVDSLGGQCPFEANGGEAVDVNMIVSARA